jgi:hypothetical protein
VASVMPTHPEAWQTRILGLAFGLISPFCCVSSPRGPGFDDVPGCGQVGDNRMGAALGDIEADRDIAVPHAGSRAMPSSTPAWLGGSSSFPLLKTCHTILETFCAFLTSCVC